MKKYVETNNCALLIEFLLYLLFTMFTTCSRMLLMKDDLQTLETFSPSATLLFVSDNFSAELEKVLLPLCVDDGRFFHVETFYASIAAIAHLLLMFVTKYAFGEEERGDASSRVDDL